MVVEDNVVTEHRQGTRVEPHIVIGSPLQLQIGREPLKTMAFTPMGALRV